MTNNELKNKLQAIANQDENTIEKEVAIEALEYDKTQNFFSDLHIQGCASGIIGSLVYPKDNRKFFDKHYKQIEKLRKKYSKSTNTPIRIGFDLITTFAWFGFEQTAYNMAMEFGLEV